MMIIPRREDAYHKMQLFRLLTAIIDKQTISTKICFKGGTCSAMLGFLDRFSVDLDFDLLKKADKKSLRPHFHQLFTDLDLEIKDESKKTLQFLLRYEAELNQRNAIKLDVLDQGFKADVCQLQYLSEIDRYMNCQTVETMFANKLVAIIDRFKRNNAIAGRDIYDIHHFFIRGYNYEAAVIQERRGVEVSEYLKKLIDFIKKHITQTIINQDLNTILPPNKFSKIRKALKNETLTLLRDEVERIVDGDQRSTASSL